MFLLPYNFYGFHIGFISLSLAEAGITIFGGSFLRRRLLCYKGDKMNRRTLSSLSWALCLIACGMLFQSAPDVNAQDRVTRRYVTGTILGVGGRFGGRTRPFDLIINRYSSTDEAQRLNAALQSGGEDELLRVLSGMDVGRIRISNSVGVPVNAIIATPQQDGSTKLIVLYQRNINFYELRYGARSENYKFGYAEIYLRPRGTSEGTLIAAARIRLRDGNTWEVEDFGAFPARLIGLQTRTSGGNRGAR